ncbi:MAG TPA: hypothetical protein VFE57_02225, partial [Cyclobacteriaceae bacterium]|nr:hypothetical protein [Cyclobacteriaceae bacterium]
VVRNLTQSATLFLDGIERYHQIDKHIIDTVGKIIVDINQEKKYKISVASDFFKKYSTLIEDTTTLKLLYLQQDNNQTFFDHSGETLLIILKRDPNFLLEYLKALADKNTYINGQDYGCLRMAWELENSYEIVKNAISFVLEKTRFGIDSDFLEVFFVNNKPENKSKADHLLFDLISDFRHEPTKINFVFEFIIAKRSELFQEAFTLYIRLNSRLLDFQDIQWMERMIVHNGSS